jgi:hypothetical protein
MRKQTYQYQEYAGAKYTTCEIGYEAGKKCALIVVDEILDVLNQLTLEYEYWEEVKQEITNC